MRLLPAQFKGATSRIIELELSNKNTGYGETGLTYATVTAAYVRNGGTTADITPLTGSPGDAYSSGKFAEVSAAKHPGLYQFHLPDALLASGADAVTLTVLADNVEEKFAIPLLAPVPDVNLTQILGTALTETGAGRLAAAFKKLLDVATPVLTAAAVNQTGDTFARLGAPGSTSIAADLALIAAIPNAMATYLAAVSAAATLIPAVPAP